MNRVALKVAIGALSCVAVGVGAWIVLSVRASTIEEEQTRFAIALTAQVRRRMADGTDAKSGLDLALRDVKNWQGTDAFEREIRDWDAECEVQLTSKYLLLRCTFARPRPRVWKMPLADVPQPN